MIPKLNHKCTISVDDFIGKYFISGNKLLKGEIELMISARSKEVEKKPKSYLLIAYVDENKKKFEYLSSMYRLDNDKYKIDVPNPRGKHYTFDKDMEILITIDDDMQLAYIEAV